MKRNESPKLSKENIKEDSYHYPWAAQYPGERMIRRFKVGAPVVLSSVGRERLGAKVGSSVKFTITHSAMLEGEPHYQIEDGHGNKYSAQYFDVELDPDIEI